MICFPRLSTYSMHHHKFCEEFLGLVIILFSHSKIFFKSYTLNLILEKALQNSSVSRKMFKKKCTHNTESKQKYSLKAKKYNHFKIIIP